MRLLNRMLFLALLAAWPCATASAQEDPKDLAVKAQAVLMRYCAGCHSGTGSTSGLLFDVREVATLKGKKNESDQILLTPGKLEESRIYAAMRVEGGDGGRMPPKKEPVPIPTAADKEVVSKWIMAGAPDMPPPEKREFITQAQILDAIYNDLKRADVTARPFIRYFTMTHMYNDPQFALADLPLYRAALSKALNSLSWKADIILPRPIDKEQTILAVDIRDLDWDRKNLWRYVMDAYPYGLYYDKGPDQQLGQLDLDLRKMSVCDLPYIRADWFIATATRPPLYHDLLQLPKVALELEYKLEVDVRYNYLNYKLARSGFNKSGVSNQNRLVERHPAKYGAYWKSYDFKPQTERGNLSTYPLGPLNLFPPGKFQPPGEEGLAFAHDGGEFIFNLPNGLQGYMLVDGKGNRIDEGPLDVVSDDRRISGTNSIVNGLSCMNCHKYGMLPCEDVIRKGSAAQGGGLQRVYLLYPLQADMDKLLAKDQARFMAAVEEAMSPYLRTEKTKNRGEYPIQKLMEDEPIGKLARLYQLQPMTIQTVACELDLKNSQLLRDVGKQTLQNLGLGALLLDKGAVINRHVWEDNGKRYNRRRSVMQRTAAEFGAAPFMSLLDDRP